MFRCGNHQAHHVACWHFSDVTDRADDVRSRGTNRLRADTAKLTLLTQLRHRSVVEKPRLREHHQQCLAMLRGRPVVASLRQPASDSFVVFTCWLIRFRRIWSIADSSSVKFSNNSARALACFEMRRDQSLRLLFIFPSYSSKAATPTTNSRAFSG